MRKIRSIGLALAVAALAVPALAQQQYAKAEDAIHYRQGAFTLLGYHFGSLGAMVQGKVPFNAAQAAIDGDVIAIASKLPFHAFAEGSDKGHTGAKAEIWKEQAKFTDLRDKMQAEVAKVSAAAKSGNLDNLKAVFGAAGQSCKNCHDNYRRRL
ncbi:MAG: cytochrome c [Proteobacteria bacterium]|nr:cytochrome c [Burkholderiales bacterium]MCA0309871.1 cytochrome c [Pseudomonadota bacterium]